MATCGEAVLGLLEAYGVEKVFGIPGVHTVELYRGIPSTGIQHLTPRHEQGAGFMADGYARASGKPGVCFLITGPGVTNAATAMGQAFSDSVPMLVISAVNETAHLGLGGGRLHELPDQRHVTAGFSVFSHTVLAAAELPEVLARAFTTFSSCRPGPVHLELPLDVITAPAEFSLADKVCSHRPGPAPSSINEAAKLLLDAKRPLVLLGGGALDAADEVQAIVERLGAPALLSIAAKGALSADHPLCLDANLAFEPARKLVEAADVVLAIGTELSETDRNLVPEPFRIPGRLIRIDIEAEQLARNAFPEVGIVSDARLALAALNGSLPKGNDSMRLENEALVAGLHDEFRALWWPGSAERERVLKVIREALPSDGILVTDSTQLVYNANHIFPVYEPRTYLSCTTGYGTLGYALPAAIGAKLAKPERSVACIIGDGGLQFTIGELATAVEAKTPIAIILWRNEGYGEIRDYMRAKAIPEIGVDLYTPDFVAIAKGFGCRGERAADLDQLQVLLGEAFAAQTPTLIELNEADFMNTLMRGQ